MLGTLIIPQLRLRRKSTMVAMIAQVVLFLCICTQFALSFKFQSKIIASQRHSSRSLQMGLGDMFSKAFANEAMPPAKNPGLSKEPEPVLVEFLPSKKTVKAFPGQKLSTVAQAAGVEIKYSCKKGECATCTVNYNGAIVKACQAAIPMTVKDKKVTIGILPPKTKSLK